MIISRIPIVLWVILCTSILVKGQVETDTSYLNRLNTLQREANIQYRKGAFDSSIHLSNQASALASTHQNWASYIEAQSRISYIHYNQGKYAQCVLEFQGILHEMDSLGVVANRWITSSMAKLAKSYDRLGEFDAAIEWHEKRIQETKYPSDGSKIDSLDLARAYNNIGSTFQNFRRYEMAGIYYDSVLNYLIKSNGLGGTFDAYINGNKAEVSKALGFHKEAERYYQRTLELIPAFENYAYGKGYIYLGYSKFLIERNKSTIDNQRALIYCDSAFYFLQNSAGKVDCYGTYAKIYGQQGRYDQSVTYYKKAIDELEKTTAPSHTRLLAYKNSLTSIYIKSGQFSLAKKVIAEIKQNIESEQTRLLSFKSDVALSEGNLLLAEQNPLDALEKYQDALKTKLPKFKPATILENPDRTHLIVGLQAYDILSQKITALKDAYIQTKDVIYMQSALECYDLMTSQLQLNTHELVELEEKLNYRGARQTIFIEAVETALTAYEVSHEQAYLNLAFHFSCLSKAAQLREQARESAVRYSQPEYRKNHAISEGLKLKIATIKQQLYYDTLAGQEKNRLEEDLFKAKESYRIQVQENVSKSDYRFKNYSIRNLLDEIKKSETFLIDYFELSEELIVFFGTDQIEMIRIPFDLEFRSKISNYAFALSSGDFNHGLSNEIYDQLLSPVLEKSTGKNKKLLVIPSEQLSSLSFESFVTNEKKRFLVEDYEVSYSYSGFLAIPNAESKKEYRYEFSGFSPYQNEADKKQNLSSNTRSRDFLSLPALPFAEKEVIDIAKIMGGDQFIGEEANESAFRTLSAKSRVIHLAMHLMLEEEQPLYSRLVLSPSEESNDGLSHAFEIYNMDIPAELVTIGACNSGVGAFVKGEGVLCLANSFLHAGAKNVINSLWAISDKTSSIIMVNFYRYLAEGKSKGTALRLAKLDYLKSADRNTSNPYFWSGLVLTGKLETDENQTWTQFAFIGMILVLSGGFFFYRKRGG